MARRVSSSKTPSTLPGLRSNPFNRASTILRVLGDRLSDCSAACAAVVASARRGLTGKTVTIDLDGGQIEIDWREDGVWMTGPTAHVFDGVFHP